MLRLENILLENVGPIEQVELKPGFEPSGHPRPLVLVGRNGTGKTLILAHIADALIEFARVAFKDVERAGPGVSRFYYKVCGGTNQRVGAQHGLAALRFTDGGERVFRYVDKTGNLDARGSWPAWMAGLDWEAEGNFKKAFGADKGWAEADMQKGSFAFFPASRREIPHWLNPDSLHFDHPSDTNRFTGRLGKPLVVESVAAENRRWLLDVLLDSMADFEVHPDPAQSAQLLVHGNIPQKLFFRRGRTNAEQLLSSILGGSEVRLALVHRNSGSGRMAITRGNGALVLPGLGHLSSGEALLLNLFLTVIRYSDAGDLSKASNLDGINGTILIDEIDAHLHTELQHDLLPRLLKLFPMVQWIITTHSPLFLLGMRKEYGESGFDIAEMPTGRSVDIEEFEEFGRAFAAFESTDAFRDRVSSLLSISSRPLVLTEGKTDPEYLKAALRVHGQSGLLDELDIESVSPGPGGGKDNLNHVARIWSGTPSLRHRPLLLLYDCDANKRMADGEGLMVRQLPRHEQNTIMTSGIENLLPEEVFVEEFWDTTTKKDNGKEVTIKEVAKAKLCAAICGRANAADFRHFGETVRFLTVFAQASGDGAKSVGPQPSPS